MDSVFIGTPCVIGQLFKNEIAEVFRKDIRSGTVGFVHYKIFGVLLCLKKGKNNVWGDSLSGRGSGNTVMFIHTFFIAVESASIVQEDLIIILADNL